METWLSKLSKSYRWIIQPLIVIGILLFGFFGAMGLSMFKEPPKSTEAPIYSPLVKTITTKIEDIPLLIKGNGAIEPRSRIRVIPQVGGRVERIHPELRAGGRFQANEILLEVERIDYELAIIQAEKEVATAKKDLQVEFAEAKSNTREWYKLNPGKPVPDLVARKPQIAEAEANLKAAEAGLKKGRLDLGRTRVRMPFSGRVVEATVDRGEVIAANQSVGTVYSNEIFEIPVPLEIDQLAWIKTPDSNARLAGTAAKIIFHLATERYQLAGQVERIEGELNSVSRLARVVVTLKGDDIPLSLRNKVIPGLFVEVELHAGLLQQVTVLSKSLLRDNEQIWAVKNGQLHLIDPDIVHQSETKLYVQGLAVNTEIVTSQLDVVTEGMALRTTKDVL